jgi:hypothetical protein
MQQKNAIVGSAIIGACVLAHLGYTVFRDSASAEAARLEQRRLFTLEQKAEYNGLSGILHDLRLEAYEQQFGHAERLRLEAFEYGERADGAQEACRKQSIASERCEASKKNRQALFDGVATFIKPSAH